MLFDKSLNPCEAMALPSVLFLILILFPAMSSSVTNDQLIVELREAKLRIARLESILEESIASMNAKSIYVKEQEKRIKDLEIKINNLQSALLSLKSDSIQANARLDALEEEVRTLWAASRKNNFDLHFLKSKAQDAEDQLKAGTSQVEKMADIVTEQWIQIQQLEQALHITEMRVLKIQRQVRSRCTLLKFIDDLSGKHLPNAVETLHWYLFGKESALSSYLVHIQQQLKILFSAVQKYHHELQGFVRRVMERNKLTAPLANQEVVFFLASAIITFPLLGVWMFLSS